MQFLNHLGIFGDRNTNVTLIGHNWGFLLGATLIKGNKLIYIVTNISLYCLKRMNKELLNLDKYSISRLSEPVRQTCNTEREQPSWRRVGFGEISWKCSLVFKVSDIRRLLFSISFFNIVIPELDTAKVTHQGNLKYFPIPIWMCNINSVFLATCIHTYI